MLNKKALAGTPSTPPAFVEDVFSTYLWDGNSTARNIVNGIDLATKGGMVWAKYRNTTASNRLYDTNRGATKQIFSDLTNAEQVAAQSLTAFNTDGFSLGTGQPNENTATVVGWTFRKQAKFFDVVTFTTGASGDYTFNHNLGSVPGCVIIKATGTSSNWNVYHRSIGVNSRLFLEQTSAKNDYTGLWGTPTATTFTGNIGTTLEPNQTHVAYLFAHNAGGFGTAGTDNVISCGSYVGDGTNPGPIINLGFEPQWLMVKNATTGGNNWLMYDVMRGMPSSTTNTSATKFLRPNTSDAEAGGATVSPTATGFQLNTTFAGANESGSTYIYMAIRRPMKVPTTGTSVFAPVQKDFDGLVNSGFPTDLIFGTQLEGGNNWRWLDRLRGGNKTLSSNATSAESTENYWKFDNNSGVVLNIGSTFSTWFWYNFKRAPGFFDTVCYTGTGVAGRTVAHNLTVTPELLIVKKRSDSEFWGTLYVATSSTSALDSTTGFSTSNNQYYFGNDSTYIAPTSSVFTVGSVDRVNISGGTYVAHLFATLAGVSKVGSYSGTGTTQTINCGFTSGARMVLIKRTDSTGDWYIWNSARGIVSGNDPYLLLNSSAAEVTNTDYVDPVSSGFEISSTAPAAINANGGTFIFLAIA